MAESSVHAGASGDGEYQCKYVELGRFEEMALRIIPCVVSSLSLQQQALHFDHQYPLYQ
jgi:hypothetical protein